MFNATTQNGICFVVELMEKYGEMSMLTQTNERR